jgi:hypothetical protein
MVYFGYDKRWESNGEVIVDGYVAVVDSSGGGYFVFGSGEFFLDVVDIMKL